jgi:putative MATE family efflux protein
MQMELEQQVSVPARTPTFWGSVLEALRGSHQDFTSVNLNRAILLLAIPMILELVLESLFAVVDVFWVGHLGPDAIATVGLTESLLYLVFAVGMGLSLSTTAMVARRIGEKDPAAAAEAGVQAIAIGLGFSILVGAPCLYFAPDLLRLMGATPQIVATGSGYTRIALGGCGAIMLLFLNNAIFRGAGDAAIAMRLLWVSNIINLILDPCLIFGWGPFPKLGVTGAALATLTGRSIGVLYQFYRLLQGTERIRILRQQIRIQVEVLLRLLRVSLMGILQFTIATTSWIGMVRIVSNFGAAALAGYTIAIRVVTFVILPSWGLSNAAATLVGQNLGAKRPDRAEQSVWRTSFYNMLFLGAIGVFFVIFAERVVQLFTHDPTVVPLAASALRILSYGNIGYAYGMVMLQAFNGAGDTRTPTIVNFFGFWVLEIPLAYALAIPAHLNSNGVFISIVAAEGAIAVASVILFKRGRWKGQQILLACLGSQGRNGEFAVVLGRGAACCAPTPDAFNFVRSSLFLCAA